MNRKQFLKHCAGGFCSCAGIAALAPAMAVAADDKKPEDWRLPFVKKRYARLLDVLADKLDEAAFNDILRQVGNDCASSYDLPRKHKGDVDSFIREFKEKTGDEVTYDREKGIITITGAERTECFCPLVAKGLTTSKVCNCSLGWQEQTFETLLGKKVKAELMETVLRGDKRCRFSVRVLEQKA